MIQNKDTIPSGWFSLSINQAFSQQGKVILQGFSEILKSRIPRTAENLAERFQLTLSKTGT